MNLQRRLSSTLLASVLVPSVVACGGTPPPSAATTPAPSASAIAPREKPVDLSPVPEPPNLVVVGRIAKPEAIVAAVGAWTKLPLPAGNQLLRSVTDDAAADVIDLSQPALGAAVITISRRGVEPQIAFSLAVRSLDEAKAKLGEEHKLVPGPNGQLKVEGIGKHREGKRGPDRGRGRGRGQERDEEEEDDDDDTKCVLAPVAPTGGRLVCGSDQALVSLVPYLTRTLPQEKWTSDVHLEIRPEPVRGPLSELRGSLPMLGRSLMGSSSPAVKELVDAAVGEGLDIVNDADKLSLDAQIGDSGVVATTRFEFRSSKSVFARMLTSGDRADAPPAAFWHLPGDTDTAFFGRGSDPKLFDRPRELLANVLTDLADSAAMPPAEKQAVKELIANRMLPLFTSGTGIYAKGFDQAAVEKAIKARGALKPDDWAGREEAKRALGEQVIGWHLYQVGEPVAKVGPVLKDWAAIWNRPAFAKWVKEKAGTSANNLPKIKTSAPPAGVTLPKDTVHLEITIPQDDIEAPRAFPPPPPPPGPAAPRKPGTKASAPLASDSAGGNAGAKPKKIVRKPIVLHVLAVPDGGATWLAFGLDGKLVAQRVAASLSSASDANTLGKTATGVEALREGKLTSGGVGTLRGLMVFTALNESERSPFAMLGSLAHKGGAPIVFTGRPEAGAGGKAGTSVGTMRVSRAFIEDAVRFFMTSR